MANPVIQNWFRGRETPDNIGLSIRNQELKAELAILNHLAQTLPQAPNNAQYALVYSHYPFNLKNELTLTLGARDGVTPNSPVTFVANRSASTLKSPGVLVGKIKTTFPNLSLVQTIFDPNWKSAVKVGPKAVDALLVGGNEPRLTLIAKGAVISANMPVYTASPDLPYGLAVGETTMPVLSADQLFWESTLKLAYDPNDINAVFVLLPNNAH
jgi:cell shape-determining protein MreC